MPLQIRRGNTSQRLGITPLPGELIYDTTTGQIFVGDGNTPGGVITTGVSLEDARDAAASLFTNGNHTGISFTYNDAEDRIDATITATAVGPFEGDLTGSVFADDSSVLVDAIDKRFIGNQISINTLSSFDSTRISSTNPIDISVSTGNVRILNLDQHHDSVGISATLSLRRSRGDVSNQLDVEVDDIVSSIASSAKVSSGYVPISLITSKVQAAPSASAAAGAIEFYTSNSAGSLQKVMSLNSDGSMAVETNVYNSSSLSSFGQHHSASDVRAITFARSRGNISTPTTIFPGDVLSKLNFTGFDGSVYSLSSQIRALVDPDATVSPGAVAGRLDILLSGNDGITRSRIEIDTVKTVHFNQFWGVTPVATGLPMYLLSNTNVTSDGARLMMRRSRGSYLAPTSVVNGDSLFRLGWGGHDGTAYRDTAFISGIVANTVSTNVIPTKLVVRTTNSVGTLLTALEITEEQVFKVNKVESLSGSTIDFLSRIDGDLEGSVFADDSTKIIDGTDGRITTPSLTASEFIKFPVYSNPTTRDSALPAPEAGMVVFLTDSTGLGGPAKLQINTDSTIGGWVDL